MGLNAVHSLDHTIVNYPRIGHVARNPPVAIEPITPRDAAACVALADKELGAHYITPTAFCRLIEDPHAVCLKAVRGQTIIGVALGYKKTRGDALAIMRWIGPIPRLFAATKSIGILKTVAVSSICQGQGVGTALRKEMDNRLIQLGCDVLVSVAWRKLGGVEPASGILIRGGYRPFASIAEFWKEDSLAEGFVCPSCGEPHYSCAPIDSDSTRRSLKK